MQAALPITVAEQLQTLAGDFSAGRHDAVVAGVRPLLQRYPALAPAHKLLGSALQAQGFSEIGFVAQVRDQNPWNKRSMAATISVRWSSREITGCFNN